VPIKHVAVGSDDGEVEFIAACYDSRLPLALTADSAANALTPVTADGLFSFDTLTGQLSLAVAGMDYETAGVHNILMQLTDSKGAFDRATMKIVLTTVNERPSWVDVCPGLPDSFSCPMVWENSAVNTLVGEPLETEDQDSTHQGVTTAGRGSGHTIEWELKGGNWGDVFQLGA
jgi:hypothetical protein